MQTPTNAVLLGELTYTNTRPQLMNVLSVSPISTCDLSSGCLRSKGMAICDILTILFPAPVLIYMYTLKNHYRPLGPTTFCYIYLFLNETIPSLFHTASIWLTVALAFQRYIYVCHAPVARIFLTMAKVRKSIFYIFIAAVIHQSTRFLDT